MFSLISAVRRINKMNNPPEVPKTSNPIRFGVMGAARIAPDAIVKPAMYHEDVEVIAVAARSQQRADEFAKQWKLAKAYGGSNAYQDLLDDDDIDAVYIGLPNSLHFEWTMKALKAGKHVLCEKPMADTAEETRTMFELSQKKNLVLLEAWQVQFHPSLQRVRAIIDEGSLGKIVSMHTHLAVWSSLFFQKNDIRFDYNLGGGALMDMGPYPINCMRYISRSSAEVETAEVICRSENIDRRIETHMHFGELPATIITDSAMDGWGPFGLLPQWIKMILRVDCEEGAVEISNYVLPHMWHSIRVIPKNGNSRVEKAYKPADGKGEEWWSAYRYQLEAFVDKVRGRKPQEWLSAEDSLHEMRTIDTIYTKCGLPLRPTSEYKHED